MKTIGQRIREKRIKLGLKQWQLGDKIGVSQQVVCHWEKDLHVPTLFMAVDIADALRCSLDELVGREVEL